MTQPFTVRRLHEGDVEQFRSLRLDGLRHNPSCFGSSYDEELSEPSSFFADRLTTNIVFGALQGDHLVGTAAMAPGRPFKSRHKGTIWGIYLAPEARGHGLARLMLEALIEEARGTVSELRLTVSTENTPATRLYLGLGFRVYGREPRALKLDNIFHDEFLMELDLS